MLSFKPKWFIPNRQCWIKSIFLPGQTKLKRHRTRNSKFLINLQDVSKTADEISQSVLSEVAQLRHF